MVIDHELPLFYYKALDGYNELLKQTWEVLESDSGNDEKVRQDHTRLIIDLYEPSTNY
jgi:hypothetical protein